MIELRPFEKLGKSDHGWLKANFHFSFADYRNQDRIHWGACVSGTTTASRRSRASRRIPTATWKS